MRAYQLFYIILSTITVSPSNYCLAKDLNPVLLKTNGYKCIHSLAIHSSKFEKLRKLDKQSIGSDTWIGGKIPRNSIYINNSTDIERIFFSIAYCEWRSGFEEKNIDKNDLLELHLLWAANAWKAIRSNPYYVQSRNNKDTRVWLIRSLVDSSELNYRLGAKKFTDEKPIKQTQNFKSFGINFESQFKKLADIRRKEHEEFLKMLFAELPKEDLETIK